MGMHISDLSRSDAFCYTLANNTAVLVVLGFLLIIFSSSAEAPTKETSVELYDPDASEDLMFNESLPSVHTKEQGKSAKECTNLTSKHHHVCSRYALGKGSHRQVLAKSRSGHQNRCELLTKRLKDSLLEAEDQVYMLQMEAASLWKLAARTMPKGLHCLSLLLTIRYFNHTEDVMPADKQELEHHGLFHYVIYSENVLAASVVVESTLFYAKEPNKHVFYILTDGLNYPAMKMWFGLESRSTRTSAAVIQVKNVENSWPSLLDVWNWPLKQWQRDLHRAELLQFQRKRPMNPSKLENLGVYLSNILPNLDKVVVLDDDIVVRKDLTGLWKHSLERKACGAVNAVVVRQANQSRELLHSCLSIVDLAEWKRSNQSAFVKELSQKQTHYMWKFGGHLLVIPSSSALTLDDPWHVANLIDSPDIEIQNFTAIHYSGYIKPWLDINMSKYKSFWSRFVDYNHPLLSECNINR